MALNIEEIEKRFGTTKTETAGNPHVELREYFVDLASYLNDKLPDGREKKEAFTRLEDASMWAHKALSALD